MQKIDVKDIRSKIDCLDKGFVQLMRCADSDLDVVNAARVSFDKESDWDKEYIPGDLCGRFAIKLSDKDTKLIHYLAEHNHWSPFSHPQIRFRIKAPIFVRTQLFKHKQGATENEVSRRYVDNPPEFYVPDFWRGRPETSIKQGSAGCIKETSVGHKPDCCLFCGEPIVQKNVGRTKMYCSSSCTNAARIERNPDVRLEAIKSRCKEKGVYFDLVPGDVVWPTHCPVLGIELCYDQKSEPNLQHSPSVDRINPNKGYTKDNVIVMSYKANTMKNSADREQILKFAEWALMKFAGAYVLPENSYEGVCKAAVDRYEHLLKIGVAPEQARMVLPQSTYTEWIWTGSLAFFARVYNQRSDPHAQLETQLFAKAIGEIMRDLFPVSWEALTNGS